MQTFSYLPSASLRTPGAVCRRKAPVRSIGGSTPWSKMRTCVRSRMPMICPSTSTESPARSSRIASSEVGNVSRRSAITRPPQTCQGTGPVRVPKGHGFWPGAGNSGVTARGETRLRRTSQGTGPGRGWRGRPSRLPVVVDAAVGAHVHGRPARGPALVVDGDGVQSHVRVRVLDVTLEDGDVAAEPHRADAGLVEELLELVLELRHERVGVASPDRAGDCLLGEVHRIVSRAADADSDDPGRARLPPGADDRVEHEALDPCDAVGRHAHLQEAHVLGARAFGDALDVEPVPVGDEIPVNDRHAVADVLA